MNPIADRVYAIAKNKRHSRRICYGLLVDMMRRIEYQGRNRDHWTLKRPLRLFVEFWVTLMPAMELGWQSSVCVAMTTHSVKLLFSKTAPPVLFLQYLHNIR